MEEIPSIIPVSNIENAPPALNVKRYLTELAGRIPKPSQVSPSITLIWFGTSTIAAVLVLALLITTVTTLPKVPSQKYPLFSSKPLVLGISTEKIFGKDSRAAILNEVFSDYGCPLTGTGEAFVTEADRYNIPYWLVAAVSFQESSCGKKIPSVDGVKSYNAWGWGVWGDNVNSFSSWNDGIHVVSKYFGEKFYSKGTTDLCTIMKTYTPPSKGSWCEGVGYFRDVIVHYESD